mmetsp:Transcript_26155/g.61002  ORF Transcript_26155/g.61002 Transcript_26155/m.61002 type:complete len:604 (-) Transcript_26155:110-1921(-)|eukprot:CAMPEP_0178405652 /NCGR_PEP_ID=MMETSP0689_2-20121128/18510_1 /TAXON_ID=160604 /ORGANISM="Amphidinium massartii, Strain CS-259" /LENGTH=603 /DNA_ID=CAMNT_0020026675 /DNA_START=22 /DNA_END=1833 /DNA_ORIENTATION=+
MGCASSKPPSFHESYTIGAKVWQGDFVQVRVAKQPYGIDDYAVRIVDLRERVPREEKVDKANPKLLEEAATEAALWQKLGSHDNILRLREVFFEDWLAYFLTDHCEYTFLYVVERMTSLNEQSLARFFRDVLRALEHIHSCGIIHCDVKPDNFMITSSPYVLKLTGFGAAGVVASKGSYKGERRGTAGTSAFMSPEMLGTKRYEFKADVWSLGVTAYVLFFGNFPYKSEENVKSGKPDISYEPWRVSRKNTKLSPKALAFCKELLNRYPLKRPSAEAALKLQYIEEADSNEVPTDDNGAVQTLLPNFCGAIRAGAFSRLVDPEVDDVDHILNYHQYRHSGPITPWTKQRQLGSLLYGAMEKTRKDDRMVPDVSMVVGNMRALQRGSTAIGFEDSGRLHDSGRPHDGTVQSVDVSAFLRKMGESRDTNDDGERAGRRDSGRDSQESLMTQTRSKGSGPQSPTEVLMDAIRSEARRTTGEAMSRKGTRHSAQSSTSDADGGPHRRRASAERTRMMTGTLGSLHSSQKGGEPPSPVTSVPAADPFSPKTPNTLASLPFESISPSPQLGGKGLWSTRSSLDKGPVLTKVDSENGGSPGTASGPVSVL